MSTKQSAVFTSDLHPALGALVALLFATWNHLRNEFSILRYVRVGNVRRALLCDDGKGKY
jgi:hypothetical protein